MSKFQLSDAQRFCVSLAGTILFTALSVTAAIGPAKAAVLTPILF